MKLDRRLNLVLTVDRADGSTVYVHSTPVSRQVYEAHYTFIHKVMSSLYEDIGANPVAIQRIVYLRMREMIDNDAKLRPQQQMFAGVRQGFLEEVWRLTNVIVPGPGGYETIPFVEAEQNGTLDDDDVEEVKNDICFFTATSWIHRGKERLGMYELIDQSGGQTTSLHATEFQRSLPTLKPVASTGATAIPSLIPS